MSVEVTTLPIDACICEFKVTKPRGNCWATAHDLKPVDTKQQQAILRQRPAARAVRKRFPAGTRVVVGGNLERGRGVVTRHVPGVNAQGGHLVVRLDTGVIARLSACTLEVE